MEWSAIATTFGVYLLLVSSVIFIMLTSVGVTYFENNLLSFSSVEGLSVAFGCGIAVSILLFAGIWVFLMFPRLKLNYFITFPVLFIGFIASIALTHETTIAAYVTNSNPSWSDAPLLAEGFQLRHRCCGWDNWTDGGLTPCPHGFAGGCATLVTAYVTPRLFELQIASIVGLAMAIVSSVGLFIVAYRTPDGPLIARLNDE